MDAAVELAAHRNKIIAPNSSSELKSRYGFAAMEGRLGISYEDGAALEGHVDAGAADLASGAQRRDDHLVALPRAGGPALSR